MDSVEIKQWLVWENNNEPPKTTNQPCFHFINENNDTLVNHLVVEAMIFGSHINLPDPT